MNAWFWGHPAENDLALFAGGELGPLSRWRIESHVNGCEACRQAVSEFFELRSQVMGLADLPHLDWGVFGERIHRAVERARLAPRPTPAWRPVWGAAMALVLLAIAGLYVARQELHPGGPVLGASANGVEVRTDTGQVLTLVHDPDPVGAVGLVSADAVSARTIDPDTGNITVTNVYAQ